MATCPLCRTKRNYPSLLFLGESRTLDCKQCGIFLYASVNDARLLRYALIAGSVAAVLAFTVVLSADFVTTVSLLLAWTLIAWAAYPFVLVLALNPRPALQSESK